MSKSKSKKGRKRRKIKNKKSYQVCTAIVFFLLLYFCHLFVVVVFVCQDPSEAADTLRATGPAFSPPLRCRYLKLSIGGTADQPVAVEDAQTSGNPKIEGSSCGGGGGGGSGKPCRYR